MSTQKKAPPYFRCEYDIPVVAAVQAMQRGEATPDQQKQLLNWIINQAAATYDISFQLDGDRFTNFAEGRRFVGAQLVKLLHLNVSALRKAQPNG